MVRLKTIGLIGVCGVALSLSTITSVSARGQAGVGVAQAVAAPGILEQMQDEVAAIVRNAKGAVVSVEDERIAAVGDVRVGAGNDANADKIAQLKTRKTALDAKIKELNDKFQAGQIQVGDLEAARHEAALLDQQLTNLQGGQGQPEPGGAILPQRLGALQGFMNLQAQLMNSPKSGSGFSIGEGYIVTTADVLDGMKNPTVVTDSGQMIQAKIVGMDMDLNIGLLKLSAKADIPALKLGDSSKVMAGHFAISIGNQTGQANSVAFMMVAGIRNEGTSAGNHYYPSLIQIAGTVGAGTSGAPVLNARGEVIGVMAGVPDGAWTNPDAFRPLPNPANAPVGGNFIVPTPAPGLPGQEQPQQGLDLFVPGADSLALPIISVDPKSPEAADSVLGDTVNRILSAAQATERADDANIVMGIVQGGPAKGDGDVRVKWSDVRVPGAPPFRSPVTSAGYAIPISILEPIINDLRAGRPIVHCWIGIRMTNENSLHAEPTGIIQKSRIVKVNGLYPDSPATRAGVQLGDELVSLNGQPIKDMSEIRSALIRFHPGDTAALVVNRKGGQQMLTIKVEDRPATLDKPLITANNVK